MCSWIRTLLLLFACGTAWFCMLAERLEATIVRFGTSSGNIDVRLYNTATPLSVQNFLNYVQSDRYVDTFIHRNAITPVGSGFEPFVIQGGGFRLNGSIFDAALINQDAAIMNEPGISNLRGTLAFARGSGVNSATSQFFFNLRANTFLDTSNSGFTVFGRVIRGTMDVVDAIAALPNIDASIAENGAAEDFDEVPVFDADKVLAQNDIQPEDAVMINSVAVLSFPDGDYDFDGVVTAADYTVWRNAFGSTLVAEPDGNGDGMVNMADFELWRDSFGDAASAGTGQNSGHQPVIPEPNSAALLLPLALWAGWRIRVVPHGNGVVRKKAGLE